MVKIFELIFEIIAWIRIAALPTVIGFFIAAGIFLNMQDMAGLVISIIIASAGLIIGIIWATRIWKSKHGTMHFISRVMATPDLDDKEKEI